MPLKDLKTRTASPHACSAIEEAQAISAEMGSTSDAHLCMLGSNRYAQPPVHSHPQVSLRLSISATPILHYSMVLCIQHCFASIHCVDGRERETMLLSCCVTGQGRGNANTHGA